MDLPKIGPLAYNGLRTAVNLEWAGNFTKEKTLDLILTSHPSFKQRCKPIPAIGNSDHDIVLLDTSIKAQNLNRLNVKIQLWKRTNIDEIQNEVRLFAENFNQKTFSNIENMWKYFKENIMKIIDQKVPTKMTTTKFTHPWINTNIKRLIRRKNKAYKKSRKTKKKRDRDRYKYLQQQTQMEIRKAHKEYMNDIISLSYTEKPKRFWSFLKSKGQDSKVPTKMTTTKFTHPWINTNIKRLIRRKNKAYKKSRKTKKKRDRDRYKYLQQQTQMEIRKAHKEYMNDIISLSYTEKPKRFWSFLKSKGQDSIGNELIDINKSTYLKGGDSRTRGGHKFYQQRVTSDVYRNSFFPRTIMEWNTLPARVAEAGSVEDFRSGLQTTH
ncbi:unnamed protein product [Mytilus edulis]|uniref:Endonuclease/exonuclease/phosphatase domain-containing protein n=1 Tax=Mytilus edulis TaxID=6550 RepID=A0A8S3SY77_MYTED|nr:unnamed protein product [Mytilus edulis]